VFGKLEELKIRKSMPNRMKQTLSALVFAISFFGSLHSISCLAAANTQVNNPVSLLEVVVTYGNNSMGIPALHYAIVKGDEAAVKLLLDHGADINALSRPVSLEMDNNPFPVLPLDYAVINGNIDVVSLLIDYGANVNPRPYSPLYFAAQANKADVVRFLMKRGAQIEFQARENFPDSPHNYNPILAAVERGSSEAFQVLLENGADVFPLVSSEPYLLHIAASQNYTDIMRLLLDEGVYVDTRTKSGGRTALMEAIGESVELLLEAEANPKAVDINGDDALIRAALRNDIKGSKALLKRGVKINELRGFRDSRTPFCMVLGSWPAQGQELQRQYLDFLLDNGADINLPCNGLPVLTYAKGRGQDDLIEWLIQRGARLQH
jgi:ankyrin repeat protein